MSSADAQVQFAGEFVTLMVAAAGLALVSLWPRDSTRLAPLRPGRAGRVGAGCGFALAGAAAFAHGSLIVGGDPGGSLGAARLAAAALVIAAAWPRRRTTRTLASR
ncbi:MAG: hypothetical protein ACRDYY_13345, partial [Acidimicrobiales bacterium]